MGLKRKKTPDTDPELDKSLQEARSLQLSALKNPNDVPALTEEKLPTKVFNYQLDNNCDLRSVYF